MSMLSRERFARGVKRSVAGLTSFFLILGGIYFGLDFAMPQAQAAPAPTARLIQVLGHFDKFFGGRGSDSEFRLDFVIEVPAGSINKTNSNSALSLKYDYQGTYVGPTPGNGVQVDNRSSGDWITASNDLIPDENLRSGDMGQQYRIIRIDKFGPVDRVTLSVQGDLGGNFDIENPSGTGAPYSRPVTMQAAVNVGGSTQYISYQYRTTTYNVSTSYDTAFRSQKIAPVLSYDNVYGTSFGNSQTNWGYVVKDGSSSVPAGRMYVSFISPWADNSTARNDAVCTSAKYFYYQWVRRDGTPTSITPTPQLKTIEPMWIWEQWEWGRGISDGRVVDVGPTDFSSEGPGYYQLVAWPIAVNPSRSPETNCSDYSYYADSVGDLNHANAFVMGSVFYTGGSMAVGVKKTFDQNPMPYQGTTTATFTLDSGNSHISGVGFTDTFPSNLYITGITRDTCGLQGQSLSQAQIDAIKSPDIKPHLEVGSLLLLKDNDRDGRMDTVKVQGGVAYNTQTGKGEVIGASVPRGTTCEIQVEVKHKETITGNSVCTSATTPAAQTNNETNVSYNSLQTVLAYGTGKSQFGECLGITRQSDLYPTGASATVLPGSTVPLSTTVTSSGPSPVDNAEVVIKAPSGTTLTAVSGPSGKVCSMKGNDVATCSTGQMNPKDTLTYNYSVVVPPTGILLGQALTGSVQTIFNVDTNPSNDSAPFTLTVTDINSTLSQFSVSTANITADGEDDGKITATLFDSSGTPVPGLSSVLQASLATDDGKTTFSNFTETSTPGTYTATVRSTSSGDKRVVVTANGGTLAVSGNDFAHFVSGLLDPKESTFTITPNADPTEAGQTNWVVANGTDSYTGTLTARDSGGNLITTLDTNNIHFSSKSLDVNVSSVTNKGAGEYTVTYTSKIADSNPTASLSVGTTHVGPSTGLPIPFKAGDPVPGPTTCSHTTNPGTNLSVDLPQLAAGETSTATALITDANCNPVPNVTVEFSLDAGTSGSFIPAGSPSTTKVTTDAKGIATATVTDTVAETVKVRANIAAAEITGSPQDIQFIAGAAVATNSSLEVKPLSVTVGGSSTATVTLRDAHNNLVGGGTANVAVTGKALLSNPSCTTNNDPALPDFGTCQVTLTDDTAEVVTVTATLGGDTIPSSTDVTFIPGPVSSGSAFTVSPASQTVGADVMLTLTIQDALGNPVNGLTRDKFALSSTNTSGVSELVYDSFIPLANGVYTLTTTSTAVSTFTFTAVVDGVTLTAKPVAQFVAAGVSASESYFVVTANDQVADGVSQDKAMAYARDQYGNPVSNAYVVVTDKTGGLNPDRQRCETDGSGSCELSWTATAVGQYVGEGTIGSLSPDNGSGVLDIRFSVGSISAFNSELTVSHTSLTVGDEATAKVTIRDVYDNAVSGGVATFSLETSWSGPGAPSLSALTCVTDSLGTCSVTLKSLLAGDVKVHATVPEIGVPTPVGGKGVPLRGSPATVTFNPGSVCFTGCSPVDPLHTTRVDVTRDGAEANGIDEDIATAYVYDTYGNPIQGVPVGTSTADPALDPDPAAAITAADGTATLRYTSTKAGPHNADVTIGSVTPTGSPITLEFANGVPDLTKSTLSVSPAGPIQVDQDYTLTASVKDALGNRIESAFVSFTIPTHVTASTSTCTTDTSGECSITVTSTVAGSHQVGAQVLSGALSDSPAILAFTAGPVCTAAGSCSPDPGVDPTHTTRVELKVNGQNADGVSPNVAVVYAFDSHGNPIQGAVVASTSVLDVTVGSIAPTGVDGSTTIQYTTRVAGVHAADVTVDTETPGGSPLSLTFKAQSGRAANSSWLINPSGPLTVGIESASTYTATTTVRDEFNNPVQGAVVTINSKQLGVTFPAGQTCTTDASGQCTVEVYSTVAGTFDFTAMLGSDQIGASLSRVWSPDEVCAKAEGCDPEPGVDAAHTTRVAVTTNNSRADGAMQDIVTVFAFDKYGNPVANASVTSDKAYSADALTIQPDSIKTDAWGVANIWYTSPVAGDHVAKVTVGGKIPANGVDDSGKVTLTFVSGPVSAAQSELSVDKASETVGGTVTATATTRDASYNPVSGVVVSFDVTGSASFSSASPLSSTSCTTGPTGNCTVTVTDTVAESVDVSATLVEGGVATSIRNSPQTVTFTPGAFDPSASSFEVSPAGPVVADGVSAYRGTLTARDSFGNHLPGLTLAEIDFGSSSSDVKVSSPVVDKGDGTYTVDYTTTVASNAYTATLNYQKTWKIGTDLPIPFVAGAVSDLSGFTVLPSPQTVGADVTLTLTIQDAKGNPVNGLTRDKFDLSSSNTSGLPELSYDRFASLGNGVYSFTTTSTAVATFTLTAVVDGVTLTAKPVAHFVAAGVSASESYFVVTANDQVADGVSQDKAMAYARDQYGNPVSGANVVVTDKTTGPNAGKLNPASASCRTDASGTCELAWSAPAVGQYVGEGTIGSLSPDNGSGALDIRFSVGNISAFESELTVSHTSLTVGGVATATVTIRDTTGNVVPGGVATFSLETPLAGPDAPSLSVKTCVADSSGTCSVTLTSSLAGDVKVHATVPVVGVPTPVVGRGDPVKGSPADVTFTPGSVCITGCNPVNPDNKTRVVVTTNGVVADGVAEDIVTAYAFDTYGNPVSGVLVETSTLDSDLKIVTASTSTAADGTATLGYTSTKAGSHTADVAFNGRKPAGSPVTLVFSHGTADPANSTLSVSPAGPIQVDQSYTITANVNDVKNNPVDAALVTFQIPGDVTASDSECVTVAGVCSITVTSTVAGSYQIGAHLPGGALSNSPVAVAFTAGPVCIAADGCAKDPGVDAAHTTRVEVTVNGELADGVRPDRAVAYAFDKHGNPVQGAVVESTSTLDVAVASIARTGVNGSTTIQYTSTVAGVHPADVKVDGGTPDGSPLSLVFAAQAGAAANSDWEIALSGPLTVGTGAASTYTAKATVRDVKNNLVQGAVVTVKSVQLGVTFPSGSTCTTDALGQCSVDMYSTVAGTFDFTALLGTNQIGASESRAWSPDAVCGVAPSCTPQPGVDVAHTTRVVVTTNNVVADGIQRDVATVYAFDQYGNPVPGALVQSTSADGDLVIQPGPITTNASGEATVGYTSTVGGDHDALVTVGGTIPDNGVDKTGKVTLSFVRVTLPSAPTIDSPADGALTNNSPLTVDGIAEPGSTVDVVDQTTGATVCTATTDAAGKWSCQVSLPDGDHTLTATATDSTGNRSPDSVPVDVKVDTAAPSAPRVDTANGTEVSGGPGSAEPGATIEVTWPDGTTDTATVNPDGSWSIPTPGGMGSGEITVTATDPAGNTSSETKKDLDTLPPPNPIIDEANGTHVTGTGEPDSKITVTWPDGTTSITTVDPGGNWYVPTPGGMPSGRITVQAEDKAGNKSGEVNGMLTTGGPAAPVVNPSDGTVITGRSEPGSTVTIFDEGGNPVACKEGVVVAGADGGFRCTPVTPLPPDSIIDVVATDKAGNSSPPKEAVIGLLGISADYAVRESGQSQTVVGTGFIPGETVSLWFCSTCSCVGTAIADPDGKVVFTFEIPEGAHPGSHILRLTGDQSSPHMGSVETTFVVAVKVDTGGSAMASDGSLGIRAGVSGLAVILILGWGVEIIVPTLRKKNVGA